MIATGCIMARICHTNNCPVGVASQREELRARFPWLRLDGVVAGCCALRPLDSVDDPNAAEMKRLYVRKAFRGFGLGRQLAERCLDAARAAGYACVLLDTLSDMEAARALYEELGFQEIPPYYHNPIAGAHYLKVDL
jgi:ribosomal protein S18 acetylase RimI-like enzyme